VSEEPDAKPEKRAKKGQSSPVPARKRGPNLMVGVGFALSAVAVGLLLWRVSFRDLWNALRAADGVWLLPALALFLFMFVLRAFRWSLLLGGTKLGTTWHANIIGYMFNVTLPLRIGEIARAYVIARSGQASMARALSAVLVERLIDLTSVLLMFAFFAQRVTLGPNFTRAVTLGSIGVAGGVIFAAAVVFWAKAVERFLKKRLARFGEEKSQRWLQRFRDITEGFRSVGSAKRLFSVLGITVAIWGTTILIAAASMRAFFPNNTDLTRSGLVVVMANLGGALPSAPGGLGIVQGFATSALVVPFNMPEAVALAFVLVWSLSQLLLLVLLGLVSLARVGLSFSEIRAGAGGRDGGPNRAREAGASENAENKPARGCEAKPKPPARAVEAD